LNSFQEYENRKKIPCPGVAEVNGGKAGASCPVREMKALAGGLAFLFADSQTGFALGAEHLGDVLFIHDAFLAQDFNDIIFLRAFGVGTAKFLFHGVALLFLWLICSIV
tara:strand:+ start:349 stop:675 length:327 start_codon:yes stop_codon:yes gene_type:complete